MLYILKDLVVLREQNNTIQNVLQSIFVGLQSNFNNIVFSNIVERSQVLIKI